MPIERLKNGPIYWAVDPFAEDQSLTRKAADLIALFAAGRGEPVDVQPVTILSPEQINWPAPLLGEWDTRLRETIGARLEEISNDPRHGLARPGIRPLPPLILTQSLNSVRRSVEALIVAAKNAKASIIVAATQSKHDLSHLVLGSFCEALLLSSPIPVLTVNPKTVVPAGIKSVYFATDLTDESRRRLPEAIEVARLLQADLVLLHKLSVPTPPVVEPGFMGAIDVESIQEIFNSHRERQMRTIDEWRELVSRSGVACRSELIEAGGGLADSLLDSIRTAPNILFVSALQTNSSLVSLVGHLSRNVARESDRPALTLPAQTPSL